MIWLTIVYIGLEKRREKMDAFIQVNISEVPKDRRFINISHIVCVSPSENGSIIYTDEEFDREYYVTENYDRLIRRINGLIKKANY